MRVLPGYLALEIDDYLIEFREQRGWDAAIPQPAVLVHSFDDNHSYLEQNKDGTQQLTAGDTWELGTTSMTDLPYTKVRVDAIDRANRTATLSLSHRGGAQFPHYVGGSMGIPWVDGGGFIVGSGRQSVVVQPGDELLGVVDQLVAVNAVATLPHGPERDALQRAAMQQVAQYAQTQLDRLDASKVRTPAELSPGSALADHLGVVGD